MVKDGKAIVAIFGGSFDPPHYGHQQIVALALKMLKIDRLIIVPAYLNPFKQRSLAPATLRLEWCHTLFDPLEKVLVSDYEISQGKSTFTSQTLRHFNYRYDVNYLVIGSDNLETLTQWHEFEWLNSQVTWVIATRSGSKMDTDKLNRWVVLELNTSVSSTSIRDTKQFDDIDNAIRDSVKRLLKEKENMTLNQRIEAIVTLLDEKKAEEIEVFNLENAEYMAKRVVIANSLNGKHTQALLDYLKRDLKPKGEEFLATDVSDEWTVADLGDILIHIMIPEYRQRYSLEVFLNELIAKQKEN